MTGIRPRRHTPFHVPSVIVDFILPVTIENTFSIMVGIIFTILIGKISTTSLTANGVINCIYNLMNAVFCILTSGGAVLVSRCVGAGDKEEASRVTGQSILLAAVGGILIALIIFVFAGPIIRMIIPSAEPALMQETTNYIRIMMFAYPFQIMLNVGTSILRAAGNAVKPLLVVFIHNILQVGVAAILILGNIFPGLGIYAAAIAYLCCRIFGGVAVVYCLFKEKRLLDLKFKHIFSFRKETLRHILSIGVPTSFEQIAMQVAYLITGSSMAVALGTVSATSLSVLGSIFTFANIPMNVCSTYTVMMVGHAIGRRDNEAATKLCMKTLLYCFLFSAGFCVILTLLGKPLAGLYSTDKDVLAMCARSLWIIAAYGASTFAIYIFETALRTGGDVKYVMWLIIIDMFLVMIPLTYLFCFVFHWGITGFIAANTVSLFVRTFGEYFRFRTGKWIHSRF